ncbi:MAG: leucyl/phenylalanyl-tRNA--protein transferase [Ichthyobacteriaceae bacterium]|nr:leucyl/phenylalanyl-tRNA--protein transferase [Ichthyobacteriaceae bacterium]
MNSIFPDPNTADEDGVVGIGANLSADVLTDAYYHGIFPWFTDGEPIVWWSPIDRMILYPEKIKISKSMRKFRRETNLKVTINKNFTAVIENCKSIIRDGENDTWITNEMKDAYINLHKNGMAHSFEVWDNDELVGGLYGVNMGKVFCGESMFSKKSNASKLAFIELAETLEKQNYHMIDCQMHTQHLESLGAEEITRKEFLKQLSNNRDLKGWNFK